MLKSKPEVPRPLSRFHRAAQVNNGGLPSFIRAVQTYNPETDAAHFRDILTISSFFGVQFEGLAHKLDVEAHTVFNWARGSHIPEEDVREEAHAHILENLHEIADRWPKKRKS